MDGMENEESYEAYRTLVLSSRFAARKLVMQMFDDDPETRRRAMATVFVLSGAGKYANKNKSTKLSPDLVCFIDFGRMSSRGDWLLKEWEQYTLKAKALVHQVLRPYAALDPDTETEISALLCTEFRLRICITGFDPVYAIIHTPLFSSSGDFELDSYFVDVSNPMISSRSFAPNDAHGAMILARISHEERYYPPNTRATYRNDPDFHSN